MERHILETNKVLPVYHDYANTLSRGQLLGLYVKDLFTWWFIDQPIKYIMRMRRLSIIMDDTLSISLLLRNFFTPWHRIPTIPAYVFGILIKLIYLPIVMLLYFLIMLAFFTAFAFWFILPIITIIMIFASPWINR